MGFFNNINNIEVLEPGRLYEIGTLGKFQTTEISRYNNWQCTKEAKHIKATPKDYTSFQLEVPIDINTDNGSINTYMDTQLGPLKFSDVYDFKLTSTKTYEYDDIYNLHEITYAICPVEDVDPEHKYKRFSTVLDHACRECIFGKYGKCTNSRTYGHESLSPACNHLQYKGSEYAKISKCGNLPHDNFLYFKEIEDKIINTQCEHQTEVRPEGYYY